MDIREICIDEIALEGLDGITIPTLWLRLQNREPKIPVQLTDAIKNYLWNYLVQHDSLEIFRLPEDRQEPQIFNRFENLTANAVAPSTAPDELETLVDVYSVTTLKIDDGVRGACSNYDKRLNITDEVKHLSYTLNTCMAQYGTRRIVVVASKELREKALLSTGVSPIIFAELSDTAYFVLERIGRARWQGELQAALNKLNFKDKTSHIYYIINKLQKFGLLVKNNHTYKRPDLNNRTIFQILVHLSRFEHDCRNFTARSIDAIRTLVKTYPDQTITLGELRDRLKIDSRSLKTMYQTMVKTGEAVIQNKNPNKAAKSIFEKSFTLIEKPEIIETEEDEDDDISNIFVNNPTTRPIILEQPFLQQAFNYMHENGSKGITQVEVLKFLTGYGRLESRNICKVLTRMKVVNTVLVDRGKQRVRVFIPTDFANSSIKNQEFKDEKKKMKKLIVESTKFTSDKEDLSACDETMDCSSSEYETSVMNDSILQGTKMDVSSQESSTSLLNDCGLNESDQDDLNFLSEDDNRANRLNKIMNYKAPQNYQQLKKWDAHLTARRIRRHNLILEQLSSEKIIEGYTTLQRVLTKAEEEEGVKTKIDKKTVMRLIDKMHEDGILQHSVIPIEHASKTEDFHFIMALDCPMKLLKSAVEQARFKRLGDEENKAARLEQKRKKNVLAKEKSIVKEAVIDTGKMTRQFFQPKFKRARTIHKLLWYLLYGHPKALNWTVEKGIVNPDESVIYCEEHTWKRFLPPAPIHFHHDQRWLQLGDVAIILPLSIFTQFHRTTHDVEDIDIWLSDNERRHTLVRHLPPTMRTQLFYKRKYMYSLMVCIEQLAFMGLVTMRRGRSGNNCNMPKENMLIYVHKNASVLDTRPTTKQHIKIEEKEYEKISFAFDHYSDVEEFWFKLQDICVQTRLGFTEFRELGYEVNADHFCTKELKKYIQNLKKGQHVPDDDGEIPGDHRGAAGLDSSMFSYLYRNWKSKTHVGKTSLSTNDDTFATSSKRLPRLKNVNLILRPAKKRIPQVESLNSSHDASDKSSKNVVSKEKKKHKKSLKSVKDQSGSKETNAVTDTQLVTVSNVGRNQRVKGGRGIKRKSREETNAKTLDIPMKKLRMQMRKRKRPKILKVGKNRIKYVDQSDLAAINKRKGRIRVNFTAAEDSLLLICHIASTLIRHLFWSNSHHPRKQMIPWSAVRDISQRALSEAIDKTSYSVGRRTLFIMKNPETRICHDISVADIKADTDFLNKALPVKLDKETKSQAYTKAFSSFVMHLQERFKTKPGLFIEEILDSTSELLDTYSPKTILRKETDIEVKRHKFNDKIDSDMDITRSVIENMTHIALTMEDADFSVYQAYRAFESFPDELLSQVFTLMQTSGFVCAKQDMVRRLPHGIRSHRLAQAHLNTFKAFVPLTTFEDVFVCLGRVSDMKIQTDASVGQVLILTYLLSKETIAVDVDIPKQIILPDAPSTPTFENQFLSMIKNSKEEFLKEANDVAANESGTTVPSSSLMAAAACVLREDLSEENALKDGTATENDPSDTKLKLVEVLRLYNRHPSYSNWLMLIKSNRQDGTESKFANLNYAVSSDSVVLSPCSITVPDTKKLIQKHFDADEFEQKEKSQRLVNSLKSVKLKRNASEKNWNALKMTIGLDVDLLEMVFDAIDNSKQFGATEIKICNSVSNDRVSVVDAIKKLKSLNIIFVVGVTEMVYVTYKNAQIWMAKAFYFSGEKEKFHDEISYEIELLKRSEKKQDAHEEHSHDLPQNSNKEIQNKYKELSYICRPWHTIGGGVSVKNAKMLVTSVYLKVFSSPGISQEELCSSFSFQQICILQILEVLCEIECLTRHTVTTQGTKRLFGTTSDPKTIIYYEPTSDGILIISEWFNTAFNLIDK